MRPLDPSLLSNRERTRSRVPFPCYDFCNVCLWHCRWAPARPIALSHTIAQSSGFLKSSPTQIFLVVLHTTPHKYLSRICSEPPNITLGKLESEWPCYSPQMENQRQLWLRRDVFFFALSPEVTGHSSPEPKVIGHELAINHSSLLLQREATYYVKKKSRF